MEDYSMYTCSRCKKDFDGEPFFKNAAGTFCQQCKKYIMDRMKEARITSNNALRGICLWCGEKITSENSLSASHDDEHVCRRCAKNRDWMLRCIRYSDRPAKYVARIEEKEAPARKAREIESENIRNSLKVNEIPNAIDYRLDRLEKLLFKLSDELGVGIPQDGR
jgi:DNA-directed RNA polymerase subunit RPC12/RpoP